MARVVRLDTDEEIGYFVDLYGPLEPGVSGHFFDAWRWQDGSLRSEPRSAAGYAIRTKIWMAIEEADRADCVLLVTPTYLDFMLSHPSFRPLPPRPRGAA